MKEKIIVVLVALLGLSASFTALAFLKVALSICLMIITWLVLAVVVKIYHLEKEN